MRRIDPQQRPPGFVYEPTKRLFGKPDRELHADDVPLTRLAERFGTPLYVYSATTIRQRYQLFDKAFRGCEHTVCYSVKANSNLSILRTTGGHGCRIRYRFRRRTAAGENGRA